MQCLAYGKWLLFLEWAAIIVLWSKANLSWLKFWLTLTNMSPWASTLIFLCLGFSIYKMEIIIEITHHRIVVKIKQVKQQKYIMRRVLRTLLSFLAVICVPTFRNLSISHQLWWGKKIPNLINYSLNTLSEGLWDNSEYRRASNHCLKLLLPLLILAHPSGHRILQKPFSDFHIPICISCPFKTLTQYFKDCLSACPEWFNDREDMFSHL